ncbi:MAG TPA: ribonuclease HI family protein [Gemmataceae bacterium]|nr:ribonuclease HI family protein [Gemmataceae bacterium]
MKTEPWTIHIDGASRGNPGPAAYALVMSRPGHPNWEESVCLGKTTNNIAEYTALVRALERASQLGGRKLNVFSDSELLVKQMNGEYRVKNADLKVWHDKARGLIEDFERVTIEHVYREQNKRADQLCNEALDGRPKPPPDEMASAPDPKETARQDALVLLRAAAEAWADGNPDLPDPETILEKLEDILKKDRK